MIRTEKFVALMCAKGIWKREMMFFFYKLCVQMELFDIQDDDYSIVKHARGKYYLSVDI